MARSSSQPHVTAALLDDERAAVRPVTCPMCHTAASLMQSAIDAGAGWRCVRCGQRWDATRLSAVAAYAAWVVERAAVGERTSPSRHASIETVGR
jgi:hypothetical protein